MGKVNSEKLTIGQILSFDKIALIVGFVVDSIALVSILLAVNLGDDLELPPYVSSWLALVIWVLAVYVYLAFLHTYWQRHQSDKAFADAFGAFLVKDLILRFRSPALLFPAVVSVITFIWIGFSTGEPGNFFGALVSLLFFGVLAAVFAGLVRVFEPVPVDESFKQRVEENWKSLEELVEKKLSRRQWISCEDLEDVAVLWGEVPIDVNKFAFALAKYAIEHPDETAYGTVHRQEDDVCVSGTWSVLINLESLQWDEYYY